MNLSLKYFFYFFQVTVYMYPDLRLKLKPIKEILKETKKEAGPAPGPPLAECHLYGDQDTEPNRAFNK